MRDRDGTEQRLAREVDLPAEVVARIDGMVDVYTPTATAGIGVEGASAAPPEPGLLDPSAGWPWDRYEDLGLLGRGGMGEVRRVRDRVLGREIAMKLLAPEVADSAEARSLFLAEARLTARLQHPGIVPLHECGALPGGLLWFTMPRVRGRTLGAVIQELHADPAGPSPEARSRLVNVFARSCEAVAYAHGEGVVHRDIKPDNVMIGEHGEVLVMDWGIASTLARTASRGGAAPSGRVLGTIAYMAPEQARAEVDRLGPEADVYALGAVLYTILCGRPPFSGTPQVIWAEVVHGPPEPVRACCRGPVPEDLLRICEHAMARDPAARPPDARALADEVRRFLDGVRRRERARALVEEARATAPAIAALRGRTQARYAEARAARAEVPPFAPEDEKARGWALEDEARTIEREAALAGAVWLEKLRAALIEAPDLDEAHDALAEAHLAELLAAEQARDVEGAARAEARLAVHARGGRAALLQGDGAVTLVTDPAGAEVWLLRYVEERRRLRAEPAGLLGRTPLRAAPLPRGSYLLLVRAAGYAEMRYPVHLGRAERWDGVRPGEVDPFVVPLLTDGVLGEGEVYVPAGFFRSGGDPAASESLPARRRWVDGFIARRHPITWDELVAFLDDLVAQGRLPEAEEACPRAGATVVDGVDVPLFRLGPGGRFMQGSSSPGAGRTPVSSVSWYTATAYAAWVAARTGLPWRLPGEEEREKAARGVDGRFFPWGDEPETTWACMVSSRPGPASPAPVDAYPTDESPYGIRGLAGNVRDWCVERWAPSGPAPEGEVARVVPALAGDPGQRSIRGGSWTSAPPAMCRAAGRFAARPEERFRSVGLRLVRPAPFSPRGFSP